MKTFEYWDNIRVRCESVGNDAGFKHIARVWQNGKILCTFTKQYYNRTWERWQYESILSTVENWLDNHIKGEQVKWYTRGQECRA
jgi:hypothetical protein